MKQTFLDKIGPYTIGKKGWNKEPIIKVVIMIYPVMGRFKIMEYNHKYVITIEDFVEAMWLRRHPWPI